MSLPQRRGERTILLAVLLAAYLVRVYALAAQSLWYDEGVSAWLAAQPLRTALAWTARDVQPPLYYLLLAGWTDLAGRSEFALRSLSVFFGMLAVPLTWRLVRLALPHGAAPMWAAALVAFHPLLFYYAQEARMYALLLTLSLAAALLILPGLYASMPWRRWLCYAAVAILALFTHYFALFLFVAFGLAWLVGYSRHRTDLTRFLAANALIVCAFAPWLVTVARNLARDASYWQGEFDLLDALHDIAIRFIAGETVPERRAIWLAGLVLILTVAGILWLWRRRPGDRRFLTLAVLWLAVPIVAALVMASAAPKFNPRYVLIALPGLVIVWALLLESLARNSANHSRILALMLAALLFAPYVWAGGNWYFGHDFDKAQWRQLAEFLRPRRTPDEALILVSGHAWPVWDYYAPDMPAQRLPDLDVLDVDKILTFENSVQPLRDALGDKSGAWLIGWQEEIVDPNDVAPTQLELAGREKGSTARFHLLSLRRFSRIHPHRMADAPPIAVEVGATFGDSLHLEGYRALDNGDLLLFWSLNEDADNSADLHVAIDVLDAQGNLLRSVPDRRLGGYAYPTFRWRPGEIVMGRIPAAEWLGPEPAVAEHALALRVYDANDPALALLPLENGAQSLTLTGVTPILE